MIPLISTLGFRAGRWFRHARRLGPSRPPIYWHGEALERRLLLAVEPVGGEFRVNTTAATQVFPAVAMDPVGDFVVTWTDASGPYVQRYDSAGVKRGSEFRVTDATNGWDPPNVAMSA